MSAKANSSWVGGGLSRNGSGAFAENKNDFVPPHSAPRSHTFVPQKCRSVLSDIDPPLSQAIMADCLDPDLLPVRQCLSLQYHQSLPLRSASFLWPTSEVLVRLLPVIEEDLFGPSSRGDASLICPVPPCQYRKSFFKQLMSRIQKAIDQAQKQGLPGSEDLVCPAALVVPYPPETYLRLNLTRKCPKGFWKGIQHSSLLHQSHRTSKFTIEVVKMLIRFSAYADRPTRLTTQLQPFKLV